MDGNVRPSIQLAIRGDLKSDPRYRGTVAFAWHLRWKHGRRCAEARARRKEAAAIRREIRRLIALVLGP